VRRCVVVVASPSSRGWGGVQGVASAGAGGRWGGSGDGVGVDDVAVMLL
jgi:hypothetical protein